MQTLNQNNLIQDIYKEQLRIFENHKPNDKKTLATYPDVEKDINTIKKMTPSNFKEALNTIQKLEEFNRMWFPDTTLEEQYYILSELHKARNLLREHGFHYHSTF